MGKGSHERFVRSGEILKKLIKFQLYLNAMQIYGIIIFSPPGPGQFNLT